MKQNPFTTSFGRATSQMIQRDYDLTPIFEDFGTEPCQSIAYILTGPRGCGKIVALSHVVDSY